MDTPESDCPLNAPSTFMEKISQSLGFVPIPTPPLCDKLYSGFLFPIDYLDKSQTRIISKQVADDLELFHLTDDASSLKEREPMQNLLCKPSTTFGKLVLTDMCSQYTTNADYLCDTQKIIERCVPGSDRMDPMLADRFLEVWREIKEDRAFLEKHNYMEYVALEELNHFRPFLHIYSAINVISPVFSLALPIVLLLLPFVLLQCWRVPISFSMYLDTLRSIAKQHFIGRILNMQMDVGSIAYTILIVGMYLLQTYGQVISCIRYHRTIHRMNENLLFLQTYLGQTSRLMREYCANYNDLPYYADFCQDIHSHMLILQEIRSVIGSRQITPYGWNAKKLGELGHMFDCYYRLYSDLDYEESLRYSVGFLGYWDNMCGIARGYQSGHLGKSIFNESIEGDQKEEKGEEGKERENEEVPNTVSCKFIDQYYPPHLSSASRCLVKNTVDLHKNMIITGVNASGKTTTLKTTALNVIFTQQFGVGFYKTGSLTPFHYVHSYLNIPDTSGRDSLFQAESRRCKEILDKIIQTSNLSYKQRHLCLFDELYSGTNPKEATKTAIALLKYLAKRTHVRFILTTHYVGVCDKFKKSRRVANYQMFAAKNETNERFYYSYQLMDGICHLEGGLEVLKQMDYPAEIILSLSSGTNV